MNTGFVLARIFLDGFFWLTATGVYYAARTKFTVDQSLTVTLIVTVVTVGTWGLVS